MKVEPLQSLYGQEGIQIAVPGPLFLLPGWSAVALSLQSSRRSEEAEVMLAEITGWWLLVLFLPGLVPLAYLVLGIALQDWLAAKGWITLESDCSHGDPWW